jgi:putative transposase
VIRENRLLNRMQVHEFVFMPNHVHLLLTPSPDISLEKCMQFIKGGFSFRAGRDFGFQGAVWNRGFNEHRITDLSDYAKHAQYTRMNPVKAGLVDTPEKWPYSSARLKGEVDTEPAWFQR